MLYFLILLIVVIIIIACIDIHDTFYHIPKIINIHDTNRIVYQNESHWRYKFYTFYSENYKKTYDLMMKTVKDDFDVIPVVVKQSAMDRCFNKMKKTFYDYRWRGCDIKIKLIIDTIHKNMGEYIVFADSDLIFLKPISGILDHYRENKYDLVITESCMVKVGDKHCLTTGGNIGILLIKCSDKTLAFFEQIKKDIGMNGWDEGNVKKRLDEETNLKHTRFPAYLVSTQFAYNSESHVVKIVGSYIKMDKNEFQKQLLQVS